MTYMVDTAADSVLAWRLANQSAEMVETRGALLREAAPALEENFGAHVIADSMATGAF
jgi:hypothetical protein